MGYPNSRTVVPTALLQHGMALIALAFTLLPEATALGQTYSLSGDWNGVANPNGVWSYGYLTGGTFTSFGTGNGAYATDNGYLAFYKNTGTSAAYGIDPGQVSLEADGGTPDARFIAPISGNYQLVLDIGGTTADEGGGYGNADAANGRLLVDGSLVAGSYDSASNIMSWNLNESLSAGAIVDAYVGAGYGAGNTQTVFQISVPEPASLSLLMMCGIGLLGRRRHGQT
jgi:hypothetical protein